MSAMLSALGSVKPAWEQTKPSASGLPPLQSPVANVLEKDLSAENYHVGRARARGQLRVALETTSEAVQLRRLEQALNHPVVQYDIDVQKEISQVSSAAAALSHRLRAQEEVASAPQSETRDKIEELLAKAATPRDWPKPPPVSSSRTSSSKSKPSKGAEATAPKAAPRPVSAVEEDADGEEGDFDEAATRIQSAFRGRKTRAEVDGLKQEKQEFEEKSSAATKIQANFRGRKTRENLAVGMEEENENEEEGEGDEGDEGEDGPDQDY